MPTISWFYGIAIRMYFVDHLPPHFEAIYGEHTANVSIETGDVLEGRLPQAAARLVKPMDARASNRAESELGSCPC
jgi:Domain of unknown function (DUF4160)